jgi:hypothetical protein
MFLDLLNQYREPLGQRNASSLYPDKAYVLAAIVLFHDFMRQPNQRALNLRG